MTWITIDSIKIQLNDMDNNTKTHKWIADVCKLK